MLFYFENARASFFLQYLSLCISFSTRVASVQDFTAGSVCRQCSSLVLLQMNEGRMETALHASMWMKSQWSNTSRLIVKSAARVCTRTTRWRTRMARYWHVLYWNSHPLGETAFTRTENVQYLSNKSKIQLHPGITIVPSIKGYIHFLVYIHGCELVSLI